MKEIWKDIDGYNGLYKVSNYGSIKSFHKKTIKYLSQKIDIYGYNQVSLWCKNKSKTHLVHRLVAIAFIENSNNYPQINHKNGIKTDNNISNLEWCNNSMNHLHAYNVLKRKPSWEGKFGRENYSSKKIIQMSIEGNDIKTFYGFNEAERITNISCSNIRSVCRGRTKTAGGYKWKYA